MFEARKRQGHREDWTKHYALKSGRWREGAYTEHIQLLMILYGDTINVSEIFTPREARRETDAQTFARPEVLKLPFYRCKCLCKEGTAQRLQRLKITFLSFSSLLLFFFQTISSSLHESISVHRSLPKAAVHNRLWHWYLLHFIIQTVNWDCRQCSSPEHINWTSRPHPDKEKGVANRLRPLRSRGVLDASAICPVDGRYEQMHL